MDSPLDRVPQSRSGRPRPNASAPIQSSRLAGEIPLLAPARGPAGLAIVPVVLAAPGSVVGATQQYTLPGPEMNWTSHLIRLAKSSTWKDLKGKNLAYTDVQQQGVPNCYLPATLAALVHTAKGRQHVESMVKPAKGSLSTICRDYDGDGNAGAEKTIVSSRSFTVTFASGKEVIVSDVLYVDDSDRDPNPRYMTSPANVLWPCIIEVAYASLRGGYDKLSAAEGFSTADFLKQFFGDAYVMRYLPKDQTWDGSKLSKLTDSDLKAALKSATSVPTLAASKAGATSITGWHGFAVLGLSGSSVELYDPLKAKKLSITFKAFREDVEATFSLKM